MTTDIILDTTTHDIVISNKDINLFDKVENLTVQRVKINLLNLRGEWFRDITTGLPYLQEITGKRNTKDVADTLIKNMILSTIGVQSILSYSSSINSIRKLQVVFSAVTESGETLTDITVEV